MKRLLLLITLLAPLAAHAQTFKPNAGPAIATPVSVANGGTGQTSLAAAGIQQTTTMSGAGVTCAAGGGVSTLTLDPTCAAPNATVDAPIVNSDADGCTVTMGESNAQLGCVVYVHLKSTTSSSTVSISSTSNVSSLNGAWRSNVSAGADTIVLQYKDLANPQWVEISRVGPSGFTQAITTVTDNATTISGPYMEISTTGGGSAWTPPAPNGVMRWGAPAVVCNQGTPVVTVHSGTGFKIPFCNGACTCIMNQFACFTVVVGGGTDIWDMTACSGTVD